MSEVKRDKYWNNPEVRWGWIDGSRYHIGYTPERIRVEMRGGAVEYVPERTCTMVPAGVFSRCSECNGVMGYVFKFCSDCGAKVVEQ